MAVIFLVSCEEESVNPLLLQTEKEVLNYEFKYDLNDIQGIIELADKSLLQNLNLKNEENIKDDIYINYDGTWWEDHQHADCVGDPALCYIVISAPRPKSGSNEDKKMTLIKVLPDKPMAVEINEISTKIVNGREFIHYN